MSRVLNHFYSTAWAILPDYLDTMARVLERWSSGAKLSEAEIADAVGTAPAEAAARRERAAQQQGVGVIPILGILSQRTAGDISTQGTSLDRVRQQFAEMVQSAAVGAIVLDIDSPGGDVSGTAELANDIRDARGTKPIIAVANSLAASAAYWIASAADEIVAAPSAMVGSIGVFMAHKDVSQKAENEGVAVTYVSAGKYKTEGNPYEPLSDDAKAHLQSVVDGYYTEFLSAVAKGRGVSSAEVRENYGQGRVLRAPDAASAGMIDRIDTLDATIARVMPTEASKRTRALRASRWLDVESLDI